MFVCLSVCARVCECVLLCEGEWRPHMGEPPTARPSFPGLPPPTRSYPEHVSSWVLSTKWCVCMGGPSENEKHQDSTRLPSLSRLPCPAPTPARRVNETRESGVLCACTKLLF